MGTRTPPGEKKDSDQVLKSSCRTCKPDKIKVVELVELVEYSGKSEHRPTASRRQYINLDAAAEPDVPRPEYGRYIKLKARVEWDCPGDKSKPLSKKAVYWYSTPGSSNLQGLSGDLQAGFVTPSNRKTKKATNPKTRAKRIVTLTDADGWTYVHFYLSRYGGDEFVVHATDNDKYEGGLKTETYKVWRKFWYQITRLNTHAVPVLEKAIEAFDKVYSEMVFSNEVLYTRSEIETVMDKKYPNVAKQTFYPGWMLRDGGSDAYETVIGDHNKEWFYKKLLKETDKPVKGHLVVCHRTWNQASKPARFDGDMTSSDFEEMFPYPPISATASFLKPALSGKLVVSGKWTCGKDSGKLTDDNIIIEKNHKRLNLQSVWVKLPDNAPCPGPRKRPVHVTLKLNYAEECGGSLEAYRPNQMIITHNGDDKSYNIVAAHELGHSFNQTAATAQPPLLKHPEHYEEHGGQGSHCSTDADKLDPKIYKNGTCIMFHQITPDRCTQRFCSKCEPYLRIQDFKEFTTWQKRGADEFRLNEKKRKKGKK